MSIGWKYLDKRLVTEAAIKDYRDMQFIIRNTSEDIRQTGNGMVDIQSPRLDGMPHAHNPGAFEDRVIDGIEEIDTIKERYRQAVEYMGWFQPAWEELSEDERFVLSEFYGGCGDYGDGTAWHIAERFNIDRSSAYRKKNRALDHLTTLLFGKG